MNMKELLYGAAYYDEYMPYDRLDKDVEMMKKRESIPFELPSLPGAPASRSQEYLIFPMWKE